MDHRNPHPTHEQLCDWARRDIVPAEQPGMLDLIDRYFAALQAGQVDQRGNVIIDAPATTSRAGVAA